jgi:hypothetical protein
MRSSYVLRITAVIAAVALSACSAIQAERQAQEQKEQQTIKRMDIAHIFVTPDDSAGGKAFHVLGDLKYTEQIDPTNVADAIDAHRMNERLKAMANEKYPDAVDAVIKAHSDVSSDGTVMTVTGEAIQFESTADREAMHHMTEGMIASPKGD